MSGSSPGSISQVKDCLKKKRSIAGKTGFRPSVAIMFYFASMARRTNAG